METKKQKLIAITDVETSGLDARTSEILEIGVVIVDPMTLEVVKSYSTKVIPTHIETLEPLAQLCNGYKDEDWKDAIPLKEAMERYAELTKDCQIAAYNVMFDWSFLEEAFRSTGVTNLMDYHRICLWSIVWNSICLESPPSTSLAGMSLHLGLGVEAKPHRAINGAMKALQVFKAIRAGGNVALMGKDALMNLVASGEITVNQAE